MLYKNSRFITQTWYSMKLWSDSFKLNVFLYIVIFYFIIKSFVARHVVLFYATSVRIFVPDLTEKE